MHEELYGVLTSKHNTCWHNAFALCYKSKYLDTISLFQLLTGVEYKWIGNNMKNEPGLVHISNAM